jgi:alkanesulfonate monooxygenase SsuD/methylene tetrahydromethanopterin reductase-like flavin-dependent oxidoreductase (luciferase family)
MGSGHIQFEHEQYRIPYYTRGTRLRMLGEAVRVIRSLLTEKETTFDGRYYQLAGRFASRSPFSNLCPF